MLGLIRHENGDMKIHGYFVICDQVLDQLTKDNVSTYSENPDFAERLSRLLHAFYETDGRYLSFDHNKSVLYMFNFNVLLYLELRPYLLHQVQRLCPMVNENLADGVRKTTKNVDEGKMSKMFSIYMLTMKYANSMCTVDVAWSWFAKLVNQTSRQNLFERADIGELLSGLLFIFVDAAVDWWIKSKTVDPGRIGTLLVHIRDQVIPRLPRCAHKENIETKVRELLQLLQA